MMEKLADGSKENMQKEKARPPRDLLGGCLSLLFSRHSEAKTLALKLYS